MRKSDEKLTDLESIQYADILEKKLNCTISFPAIFERGEALTKYTIAKEARIQVQVENNRRLRELAVFNERKPKNLWKEAFDIDREKAEKLDRLISEGILEKFLEYKKARKEKFVASEFISLYM